ncbi:MAG: metallophosphatase family protein, partial [Lentisphaeraceae bacterium]|nr:metallophosphatase family protein [Lentisphaeraceae bacterium]
MRYGIVSDVHANIQAWKAVLRDMKKEGVDSILCLGDVIGYGPNPAEVLDSCYQHVDYFILGNHDAVIGNRLDSSLFNDNAKYLIEWTREQLNDAAADFFADMPLRMEGDGFICAHGELAVPGRFNYIYEAEDAIESFTANQSPLMFVGHTHFPAKFRYDLNTNLVHKDECIDGLLKPHERYLVNAGSVGDPRDGSTAASYCIYEADTGYLKFKQVP